MGTAPMSYRFFHSRSILSAIFLSRCVSFGVSFAGSAGLCGEYSMK